MAAPSEWTPAEMMTIVASRALKGSDVCFDGTGWAVKFATKVADTPPPTAQELGVLRDLHARTKAAIQAQQRSNQA